MGKAGNSPFWLVSAAAHLCHSGHGSFPSMLRLGGSVGNSSATFLWKRGLYRQVQAILGCTPSALLLRFPRQEA